MPTTPLQVARDQAIIGRCLAEAIEQSGLAHLIFASPRAAATGQRDPAAARSAAARARNEAIAAHARAVKLRLITETICDSAAAHAGRAVMRLSAPRAEGVKVGTSRPAPSPSESNGDGSLKVAPGNLS